MLATKRISAQRPATTTRRTVLRGIPPAALLPVVAPRPANRRTLIVRAAAPSAPSAPERHDDNDNNNSGLPKFGGGLDAAASAAAAKWTMMAGNPFGSFGGSLGATMERSPLSFVMPTPVQKQPVLDDGGDGSGIGRRNHNGGGGGDGGDDDDDDYFDEEGDGEGEGQGDNNGGLFMRTLLIPEAYDALSIAAVFGEWMRTVADLPLILRRAVEMGLFSSAQLVRFFSMDVRPSVARTVTRTLPPTWAREFVGRLMADPAFAQKLALESLFAASASMFYEWRVRGENFRSELDLATINSIGLAGATAAAVWMLAPTRSYGAMNKFPWQQMLEGLPNCVFDVSGPLRHYSVQTRLSSFFAKAAELSAVGAAAGVVTSLASTAAVEVRRRAPGGNPTFEPSVPVPELGRSSGGLAAFFATNVNLRYQAIGGLDRFLFGHSHFLWAYLGLSGATRLASMAVGETSRPWFQGLPAAPPMVPLTRTITRRVSKRVSKRVPRSSLAAAAAVAVPASYEETYAGEEGMPSVSMAEDGGLEGASSSYAMARGEEATASGEELEGGVSEGAGSSSSSKRQRKSSKGSRRGGAGGELSGDLQQAVSETYDAASQLMQQATGGGGGAGSRIQMA